MSDKIQIPNDAYESMITLWNAVYQEYKLGEVYYNLAQHHSNIKTEWVLNALPDVLKRPMLDMYNMLHKYDAEPEKELAANP